MSREFKPCRIEGCSRKARTHGLCKGHYQREARGLPLDSPIRVYRPKGSPRPICTAFRCTRPVKNRDLCGGHYRRCYTVKMPDWNRPLKLYRRAGQTKDVSVRMSRAAYLALSEQAKGLRRDVSEHLRTILEEFANQLARVRAA